jgi:hypothetical protein
MYSYNLIIKHEFLDHAAARALVNRQLVRRFGPDVHYYEHAYLTHEIIIVVSNHSKWKLQSVLGDWFGEDCGNEPPYANGALLHYREILRDEPSHILNKLGG